MYPIPMVTVEEIHPQIHPQAQREFLGIYSPAHQQLLDKLSKRGVQKLDDKDGLYIIQQFPVDNTGGTCSQEPSYYIYPLPKKGQTQSRILFKAKKKPGEPEGCGVLAQCGSIEFVLSNATVDDPKEEEIYDPTVKLIRQLKGPLFCKSAQVIVKSIEDGQDEYLGKVVEGSICCGYQYKVYDRQEDLKYIVEGSECQAGMCFKACGSVVFRVKSIDGKEIAKIVKEKRGWCQGKKPAKLELTFPKDVEVLDKAYLMAVMLMIDSNHF